MRTHLSEADPPPTPLPTPLLTPATQRALVQLFPEFPPWALLPLVGGPFAPFQVDQRHALQEPFKRHTRQRRTHLTVGSTWKDPEDVVPLDASGIALYAFYVEGFELTLEYRDDPGQHLVSFEYQLARQRVPFGISLAISPTPNAPWTHPEEASNLAASFLHSPARAAILRRWAAVPDRQDRELIAHFWLGHTIPVLAELGMVALGAVTTGKLTR
jgi:hypothetical protein